MLKGMALGATDVAWAGDVLWRQAVKPGLLYGAEIIPYTKQWIEEVEKTQRKVGRWILGVGMSASGAGIRGEMGWTTIAGEIQKRKVVFYERIRRMKNYRWVKQILDRIERQPEANIWYKQVQEAQERLGTGNINANAPRWKTEIKKLWRQKEQEWWLKEVKTRRSLSAYPEQKLGYQKKNYVDFTKGSKCFARVRIGNIVEKWKKGDQCKGCGEEIYPSEAHIILECQKMEQVRTSTKYRDWINYKRGSGMTDMEILK
jgi:hypothetical protein